MSFSCGGGVEESQSAAEDAAPDADSQSAAEDAAPDAGEGGACGDGSARESDAAQEASSECLERLQAFDASCQSDADCALVVLYSCYASNPTGTSRAIGIRRDQVDAFRALAQECQLPNPFNPYGGGCPGEPNDISTDDGNTRTYDSSAHPAVRCTCGGCQSLLSSCGPALCGNGQIDTCHVTADRYVWSVTEGAASGDRTIPSMEPCDGTDLAGETCESLGYAGGTLSCIPDSCLVSSAQCRECRDPDNRLLACESALGPGARTFALAASDTEIAAAWFAPTPDTNEQTLRFTRFSFDFVALSEVHTQIRAPLGVDLTPSLIPHASGWVVAVNGYPDDTVEIHGFDFDGVHRGLLRQIDNAHSPSLIASTSGAPLLLYSAGNVDARSAATVLSADLRSGTPPADLGTSSGSWDATAPTAISIGTAFLFADTFDYRQRTGRIELDGSWSGVTNDIGSGSRFNDDDLERLVLTSSGPVLVYYVFADGTYWVALDEQGAPISRAKIAAFQSGAWGSSMLGFESDALATTGAGMLADMEILRIGTTGETIWQAPILTVPGSVTDTHIVQRGKDIVVGWLSERGVGLAKIQP